MCTRGYDVGAILKVNIKPDAHRGQGICHTSQYSVSQDHETGPGKPSGCQWVTSKS